MTLDEQLNTWLSLHNQPRNIYQNADFYAQNRLNSAEVAPFLKLDATKIAALAIEPNLFDCRDAAEKPKDWARENAKFLNYHRSLTPYTLLNGLPFSHYLGAKTGLAEAKNQVVIDVGGGTGQTLVNFFRHGESLTYFLVYPNVRLLHDQFIRIYPQLLTLKMGHILAMGENLPFKNEIADIVLCFAAIDHMADYQQFIKEALRVLKPKGQLLITGHLDVPTTNKAAKLWRQFSLFSPSFLEFITRRWHQFRNRVALDDHTVHFETTGVLEKDLIGNGFRVLQSEVVGTELFFILAEKN
jgi:ubiquinone/menaquinone biosynthesis C-methylase UbiE